MRKDGLTPGLLVELPTVRQMHAVRKMAKKGAVNMTKRQHCWPMLGALAHPGHRVDPVCYVAYTHVCNVQRALRRMGRDELDGWLATPP